MNVSCSNEFDPEKLHNKLNDIIAIMFSKVLSEKDHDELKITNELHKYITENVIDNCMENMTKFWESHKVNERLLLLNELRRSSLDCPAWRPTTGKVFGNSVAMVELRRRREIIQEELSKVHQQNAKLETELMEVFEETKRATESMKAAEAAMKSKVQS